MPKLNDPHLGRIKILDVDVKTWLYDEVVAWLEEQQTEENENGEARENAVARSQRGILPSRNADPGC